MNFEQDLKDVKLNFIKKKHFAFFGSLLSGFKFSLDPKVKNMQLDGLEKTIHLNPDWFNELSSQHKASALAHEVLHYALEHDIRIRNKDPELYGLASEHVVNNLLMDCNFELPSNVPVDRRFQHKSTEEVYKILEYERNENDDDKDQGDNPFGNDLPNPSLGMGRNNQISNNVINARRQEVNTADLADKLGSTDGKSIGTSNEAFSEVFRAIKEGKLDWKIILSDYLNELVKGEREYARLDRRMLSLGYYLPDNHSEDNINKVALALDVSGSISEQQIRLFLQEIKVIKNNLSPKLIDVMSFNTDIVDVFTFEEHDDITDVNLRIGGGTCLQPVFQHYNKSENKPEFLIVFSDMEVEYYNQKSDYHVIYICFDNPSCKVPYGTVIHINTEDL